jgi:hypothetical protein
MAASMKATDFWIAAIALMKAACTSETSINFFDQTTRRSIPEDSHL